MQKLLAFIVVVSLSLAVGATEEEPREHLEYPDRPVKLIVPHAAGEPADMLARALAAGLGVEIGQPVLVENKPGANTLDGTNAVARARADGYTVLFASSANMVLNPLLYRNAPYAAESDFRVLAVVAEVPLVVVTNSKVPARDLQAFADHARAHAGRIGYGSVGLGHPLQLATEMLKDELQIEARHAPYRDIAGARGALMGDRTQFMIDVADDALPLIRSGKLHALAATGSRRVKSLPEVQTVAESGVRGFHAALWFGAAVRADTPPPVATRLRTAINRMMVDPAFLGAIAAQAMQAQPLQSEGELRRYVERDRMRWGKVIREHNVRLEAPER